MSPKVKLRSAIETLRTIPDPHQAEVCGLWLWVKFPTKPGDETRTTLKTAGFRWARRKEKWYFAAVKAGGRRAMPMEYIRTKYGSTDLEEN